MSVEAPEDGRREDGFRGAGGWLRAHRFFAQLVALTLLLLFFPFFERGAWGWLLLQAFSLLVVVFALNAVSTTRGQLRLGLLLAAPDVVVRFVDLASDRDLPVLAEVTSALFLGYVGVRMIRSVLASRRVTHETVAGALCAYVLFGLVWASFYTLLELAEPGSIRLAEVAGSTAGLRSQMVYFSFVTQTTLGFGDIVPLSPPMRSFAIVQALLAQFYLAALIARLVALAIAHGSDGTGQGGAGGSASSH